MRRKLKSWTEWSIQMRQKMSESGCDAKQLRKIFVFCCRGKKTIFFAKKYFFYCREKNIIAIFFSFSWFRQILLVLKNVSHVKFKLMLHFLTWARFKTPNKPIFSRFRRLSSAVPVDVDAMRHSVVLSGNVSGSIFEYGLLDHMAH